MRRYIILLLGILLIASCKPPVYTPKPPGYFKLDTPAAHQYRLFDRPGFPYTFEYPVYAVPENDTMFTNDSIDTRYWININFITLGAMINITYKEISAKQPLSKLVEDSYGMSFFHHEKADYIQPVEFRNPYGTAGIIYVVGGNAASGYQFTATDSVKNFIRGALYFNVTPNADSLKPASDFIERDIEHMLYTLQWRTPIANPVYKNK